MLRLTVNNLLEAALYYHQEGFSVIPLRPRGKEPLAKWEDYSKRRASVEEIRSWWEKTPNANIAIITGEISGVIAVDVDVYRGGDAKKVYDIAPTEMISKTGRGGYHLLYRYSNDISKNVVGENGVDVRSNGGYIVAPPSIHENGKSYEWIRNTRVGKVNKLLASYVKPKHEEHEDGSISSPKWVADALLGVGHGSRNDTCAKLAGYYAGKGIPKDIALIMMVNWDGNNNPPLGMLEVETTVNSVYKTSYRYTPPASVVEAQSKKTFNVINMDSYMKEYGDNAVTWIIPDWLPEQTIAFAVSPPGTYKTWMLLDLAVSVASGTDFLGKFEVSNKGPVLMIQQEDHHGGLAERLGVIMNSRYGMLYECSKEEFGVFIPPELPIYFHPDRQLKFNDKWIMDELEKIVAEIKPRLVIIDPLYSAAETDDYMAKSAGDMFRLKTMRDKYHCSFIIAHHKKKRADGNEREGLWGSQFLNAFLETGWQIRSTGKTSVSILRHFKVKKASTELAVNFDVDTEIFPYKYEVYFKDGGEDEEERDADIINLLGKGPMGLTDIVKALDAEKIIITRKLKLLEKDHVVIKTPDKKYKLLMSVTQY